MRWRGLGGDGIHFDPQVAIIGAGLGGVACAVNLSRAGFTNFTVYEQAGGPGGVWWHNTYPGCEVDVNSQAYSYSFLPYMWNRTHATQSEVLRYVEHVIDHYRIRRHFNFGVTVSAVRWNDATRTYLMDSSAGVVGPVDVVVSSVGFLSAPAIPDWAVSGTFEGPIFHTARYEHEHDLWGKTVAIVGTGSSACQLAPILAEQAEKLVVYQREPGYVLPKRPREFSAGEQERYRRRPFLRKIDRWKLLRQAAKDVQAFDLESPKQQEIRQFHASYLDRKVADPEVREALRPSYAYGCKRPVFASGYYSMFNRPNVELVPKAVARLSAAGVVDADGTFRAADAVILATGFQATNYLGQIEVTGPAGRSLHQDWGASPAAFLGMTVPGYPNFFILYGPNTNGGWSICAQLERQSELLVRMIRRIARRRGTVIDTRLAMARRYDRWIQKAIRKRRGAFAAGCHNYYYSATGKNVTQWPFSHMAYALATKILPVFGLVTTRCTPEAVAQGYGAEK
jgi:cation diffusion facilitator CzcD-associated flavoprotein CzcO